MLRSLLSSAAALGALAFAAPAFAVDATPCTDNPLKCQSAPISFERSKELPVAGGFDTGFIPANSPLQVRLYAGFFAETLVRLNGALRTSWPEPLTLATPGDPQGGELGIHYGLDIGAKAKISFSVGPANFNWEGDVPGVPQIDWQIEEANLFDPWAFNGFAVNGTTPNQTLYSIDVLDFVGINIPGLSGDLDIDVAVDLDARYRTKRIVITHVDGEPVAGGPIEADDATSLAQYLGGPSVDLDVSIDGQVRYEGVIRLTPAFNIGTSIGFNYSIPIVEVPFPFDYLDDNFSFDPVRVHVPLPDIELEGENGGSGGGEFPVEPTTDLDFGVVQIGTSRKLSLTVKNVGEAVLAPSPSTNNGAYVAAAIDTQVLPSGETKIEVTFTPTTQGPINAVMQITSNDPDEPVRTVQLSGEGGDIDIDPGDDDDGNGLGPNTDLDDDGCGCRVVGAHGSSDRGTTHGGAALLALGLGLALRRRRR